MRFMVSIGRTRAGSVELTFTDLTGGATSVARRWRELSARIYDLAAALEREAADLGASWAVSPRTFQQALTVEHCHGDNVDHIERIVRSVIVQAAIRVEIDS